MAALSAQIVPEYPSPVLRLIMLRRAQKPGAAEGATEPLLDQLMQRARAERADADVLELRIAERARYFTSVEAERRSFFAESFDITLVGRHPWFAELASAYRRSGHNAMEIREITPEALYRHKTTRAFPKSIVITDGPRDLGCFALLEGSRLSVAGHEWTAASASNLAYPLLAAANAVLWRNIEDGACRASR